MLPVAPGMSVQFAPEASQRCHWWVTSIGPVPVQAPSCAVSVPPSVAGPVTLGAPVLAGASATTASVAGDVAVSVPPAFVAVTTTRMAWPTSAGFRSYVAAVAPGMSAQFVPSSSQRRHWYA